MPTTALDPMPESLDQADLDDLPVRVIECSNGSASIRLCELWSYRELVLILTLREVKLRYKQTALGAAWAIIQPLFTMLVFSLFFGKLAKVPSDGIPYPLFSFTALIPWIFFANGLTQSSNSLVSNSDLISKVYFPRLVIPLSAVLSGTVDFAVSFVLLLGMVAFYGIVPPMQAVLLPAFFALAFVSSLGAGVWLSALNVEYRDVRFTIPFITQFWMFATPIAYPASLLHEPWRSLYGLNPMVGVVEGFRWALLGGRSQLGPEFMVSTATALVVLISGIYYFRRMERTFADVI
jgi:lipopolysaccharide transport system permease protein